MKFNHPKLGEIVLNAKPYAGGCGFREIILVAPLLTKQAYWECAYGSGITQDEIVSLVLKIPQTFKGVKWIKIKDEQAYFFTGLSRENAKDFIEKYNKEKNEI